MVATPRSPRECEWLGIIGLSSGNKDTDGCSVEEVRILIGVK